jgi:quinol monooxygenase YgiN
MTKVTLTGFIVVPDGDLGHLKSELSNHIRLTREEPGCISFTVSQSDSVANRFAPLSGSGPAFAAA